MPTRKGSVTTTPFCALFFVVIHVTIKKSYGISWAFTDTWDTCEWIRYTLLFLLQPQHTYRAYKTEHVHPSIPLWLKKDWIKTFLNDIFCISLFFLLSTNNPSIHPPTPFNSHFFLYRQTDCSYTTTLQQAI